MDLNNSKLVVRGKLTKPDGGNIAGGTRVWGCQPSAPLTFLVVEYENWGECWYRVEESVSLTSTHGDYY